MGGQDGQEDPVETGAVVTRTWRTDDRGRVHVTDDGGPEWLPFPMSATQQTCDHIIARFGDLFRAEADAAGIPWAWLVAMAYRESGGYERAQARDGGSGLFQITDKGLRGGHSDIELYDPQLNTNIAAHYIASLIRRYGHDFPKISAAFNAGSVRPDPKSAWNMHATGDHIDAEVRALNYTLTRTITAPEAAPITQRTGAGPHASDQDPEPPKAA